MRHILLACWLSAALSATGCSYTLQPIFTEKELVHDVDLNGVWQEVPRDGDKAPDKAGALELAGFDRNSSYEFQGPGKDNKPEDFVLRVGRLGDVTLAELSLLDRDGPPILRGLPVYVVFKLERAGDTFTLRELDDLKCRKLLEQDKVAHFVHLGARKPDIEHTIITAPTSQVQEFLRRRHAEVFTGGTHVFRKVAAKNGKQR